MNDNLSVPLISREDRNKDIYHLGRIRFPGGINCRQGVAFLVYTSEEGEEEMQIATLDQEQNTFASYTQMADRLKVNLSSRIDQYGKKFFICKIKFDGFLDCTDTLNFMVFTSKEGGEQLQIIGNIITKSEEISTSSTSTDRFRAVR